MYTMEIIHSIRETFCSFTDYDSNGFGIKEQIELSDFCKNIDKKHAKFLLSNSNPNNENKGFFIEHYDLYKNRFRYKEIDVRRSINSDKSEWDWGEL